MSIITIEKTFQFKFFENLEMSSIFNLTITRRIKNLFETEVLRKHLPSTSQNLPITKTSDRSETGN